MVLFVDERVKSLREKFGMTQQQLAKEVGIAKGSVKAWENATSAPSVACLAKLSEVFGVTTDYLLNLEEGVRVDISGLNDEEQGIVLRLVDYFKSTK